MADQAAFEQLREIEEPLSRSGKGLVIDLVGGIGDQLQTVARVTTLTSCGSFQSRLWLRPSKSNARLVGDWLQSTYASNIWFGLRMKCRFLSKPLFQGSSFRHE